MLLTCAIVLSGYFSVYPQETKEAISFLDRQVRDKLCNALTKEEAIKEMKESLGFSLKEVEECQIMKQYFQK